MKPNGIIDFSIEEEKVFIEFKGSKSAFKTFTTLLLEPLFEEEVEPKFKLKIQKALYFDKPLTDDELIKLTSNK
jgi:hypothetical protein